MTHFRQSFAMGGISVEYEKRRTLPACILTELFIRKLWELFQQEGTFSWQAAVGSCGSLLPKNDKDPEQKVQTIGEQAELLSALKSVKRIDQFTLTVEIENKGFIVILFRNVNRAYGTLLAAGHKEEWVEEICERIEELFIEFADPFVTHLFGKIGFGFIHSVIPLVASSLMVILFFGLIIPGEYRHSELIWWISAISLLITLRLAYSVSNYLILHALQKYPYIRWGK